MIMPPIPIFPALPLTRPVPIDIGPMFLLPVDPPRPSLVFVPFVIVSVFPIVIAAIVVSVVTVISVPMIIAIMMIITIAILRACINRSKQRDTQRKRHNCFFRISGLQSQKLDLGRRPPFLLSPRDSTGR